jgi:putative redox protein
MGEKLEVSFPGGKRVDIAVGDHKVPTDQSVKAGGEASAPEPFALFLASIAGCAGIYALNFCQSREISTEGLSLSLDWERSEQQRLDAKVRLQLRLPAGFPEKYRNGILKAMDQCTVKKYIQNPPAFTAEIVD